MPPSTSRTPKRLTAKGESTRARIIEAAAASMFERGVAATSLDDVKASAEVSSSQLYHYFEDKSALVRAVVGYQADAVLAGQQPYLSRLDSMEALRAWADAVVAIRRKRRCRGGCPIGSLASELAESDPVLRAAAADGLFRWEESIRTGLEAMRARGELLPGTDVDMLATAILASAQGGILLSQVRRTTAPLEAALTAILDHIASLMVPRRNRAARPRPSRAP